MLKKVLNLKLQKHKAYKYKGETHYKHVLVIPQKAIEKLGWDGGEELEFKVEGEKLIVGTKGV